jgi:purine-binding chemotaxis protein CheW
MTMTARQMQYLRCRVGREWYGIAVEQLIEVLQLVALNEIPGAKPHVLGLLTLRDVVMPVMDLRILFNMDEAALSLDTPIIAINTAEGPVGIVVDDVDDVRPISEITDRHGHESPFISAAAKVDDRLLLLLDVERLREPVAV